MTAGLGSSPRTRIEVTGIGKVNAAIAAARLASPANCAAVINLGICGALPRRGLTGDARYLAPGSVVVATQSVYADEGVATPEGFLDCTAIGFPLSGPSPAVPEVFLGSRIETDQGLRGKILDALGPTALAAPIATVSTCSGTDALAEAVATRTGAAVEAMEGAAIGHALAVLHHGRIPFCEVRVVSNNTGDRASQRWDMKTALEVLGRVAGSIARTAGSD